MKTYENNLNVLDILTLSRHSKEITKEIIKISNETGRTIIGLYPYNSILELEQEAIKINTMGY